jgi:hypothetical protein
MAMASRIAMTKRTIMSSTRVTGMPEAWMLLG